MIFYKNNQKGLRENYSLFIHLTFSYHCNRLCFCSLVYGIFFSNQMNSSSEKPLNSSKLFVLRDFFETGTYVYCVELKGPYYGFGS